MRARAPSAVPIGAANASANASTSGPACEAKAPSPATIATRRAPVNAAAARARSRSSATGRCAGIERASGSMTVASLVWPSSMTSPCSPDKSRWVGRGVSARAARQA